MLIGARRSDLVRFGVGDWNIGMMERWNDDGRDRNSPGRFDWTKLCDKVEDKVFGKGRGKKSADDADFRREEFLPRMNTDFPSAAKPQPKWIVDG